MAFLYDDVSNPRLVILLEADASLPDGQQLVVQNLHANMQLEMLRKQPGHQFPPQKIRVGVFEQLYKSDQMNVKNARNSFEQLNLLKLSLENMRNLECTFSLEVLNKTIKLLP